MTVTKVKRLVNPHKTKAKRKLSPAQIRIFGTPAQKAALRGGKVKAANPAARKRRIKARRKNPASLITLGLVNPHKPKKVSKGRKTVATKRKKRSTTARKANPVRRRRRVVNAAPRRRRRTSTHRNPARRSRVRRNGTKIYVMRRNGRRRVGRGRNPEVFGMKGKDAATAILSGLVGVYATKTLTPMVLNAIPQIASNPIFSALVSGAIAYGGGMLLTKWDKRAGEGFMFGGLMQAGSSLLNLVVPSNPLSLSGLGDIVPASFPVPMNPILAAARANAGMIAAPSDPSSLSGAVTMFR